jgi:hypothetical protein
MSLEVVEKQNGNYTNKSVEIKKLKYGTSCTVRLQKFKSGESKDAFNKNEDGTPKMKAWFLYVVDFLEPSLGSSIAMFVPNHLHRSLEKFQMGDVLKLTAEEVEKEFTIQGKKTKRTFKGFVVEKVALRMSEKDMAEFAANIKTLRTEGAVSSDDEIKTVMAESGYTHEDDVKKVIELSR